VANKNCKLKRLK